MAAASPTVRMRLVSNPYRARSGLIPLVVGVGLGWAFILLWAAVAFSVVLNFSLWGILLLAWVAAFAVCLGTLTYGMVRDACKSYVFEISDSDAVLTVEDKFKRSKSIEMVVLKDIKYAEYYPYTDSAMIIFHTPYLQMEVPLWPMGTHAQDVVDFLGGRGVTVVNVQTDDKIPD